MKYYLAYGSNLDPIQMQSSCPDARFVKEGILNDFVLLFRGNQEAAYATIKPMKGMYVPFIIWEIPSGKIDLLDRYEDFPHLYNRSKIQVGHLDCFYYWMLPEFGKAIPKETYVEQIKSAYLDRCWDLSPLYFALSELDT